MGISNAEKQGYADSVHSFVNNVTRGSRIVSPHYNGKVIRKKSDLIKLVNKLMQVEEFAFDTEFSSLRMQYYGEQLFVGCSFSWGKHNNYYVPINHVFDDTKQIGEKYFAKMIQQVFDRTDVRIIGHNLKVELHALKNIGVDVKTKDLFDTLIAVWNIDENNENGLKAITKNYYNYDQKPFKHLLYTIPKEVKLEAGMKATAEGDASLVDVKVMAPYAMDDTFWTWKVYCDVFDVMDDEGASPFFFKRQMPYLKVLYNMERRGVPMDFQRLRKMDKLAEKDLEDLEYKIFEIAGIEFSVTSGQQVAEILFGWSKPKPIYEIIYDPIMDEKTGEQAIYKSGKRKGEKKWKETKNKDNILRWEESGNQDLIDNSFGFPVIEWSDGGKTGIKSPKTGADELEELATKKYKSKRKMEGIEMVKLILTHKKLSKLKSTYMEGLAEQVYQDGKAHTSFNQTGTTSGRLSSSGPNLQQLPRPVEEPPAMPSREDFANEIDYKRSIKEVKKAQEEYEFWSRYEIRDAFIAGKEGYKLVALDWSNLEMRILAHFSQDPLLLSMFARGVDVHGDTAINMFDLDCEAHEVKKLYPVQRQQAKTLNFLLVYGGSPSALAKQLGVPKAEAQYLFDRYFETYTGVRDYMSHMKRMGHRQGYVQTVLGRKRHLDGINSPDYGTKGYFERLAVNAPIQGSAADIAISAQLLIEDNEELKDLEYEQLLQVHDKHLSCINLSIC